MGVIKRDALRITFLSYIGMFLGYFNKAFLFLIFLTTDEIGLLNLLMSVGVLFAQFCNLGTTYSIGKFYPFFKNKERNNYGFLQYNFLIVTIGVVLFTLLVVIFKNEIANYYIDKSPVFVEYYYWFLPIGIGFIYFLVFENYLKMLYNNFFAVLINEVILRLLTMLAIIAYGLSWIDFGVLVKSTALLYFFPTVAILLYLIYLKEFKPFLWKISIPKRFRKIIFRFNLLSYINTLGNIFVTTIDAMMVASMLGLRETGIYTTIVFITVFLQVPYRTISRVANPLIANFWKSKDMVSMEDLYKKTSSILLIISTTLFMYIWINRDAFFYTLRPEFVEGVPVFLFLMIGRLTDMYMGLNGAIFTLSKKFAYDLIFTFSLIILVFFMNLWLIPIYGMSGAALGTMVVVIFYNFGRALFVWVAYKLHPFAKNQFYVLLILGVNILLFELIPHLENRWIDMILRGSIFSVTYPLVIYLLRLDENINSYVANFYKKNFKKVR